MITVVGTGTWGTTLAVQLARADRAVHAGWPELRQKQRSCGRQGENERFLPGTGIPPGILITGDPLVALEGSDLILLVVPSEAMRRNIRWIAPGISG